MIRLCAGHLCCLGAAGSTRCVLTRTPHLQHALTIQRQTGGLGISIAGGKGSTPYKGDDEVSSALVLGFSLTENSIVSIKKCYFVTVLTKLPLL